jgi:hypothetical protein
MPQHFNRADVIGFGLSMGTGGNYHVHNKQIIYIRAPYRKA